MIFLVCQAVVHVVLETVELCRHGGGCRQAQALASLHPRPWVKWRAPWRFLVQTSFVTARPLFADRELRARR